MVMSTMDATVRYDTLPTDGRTRGREGGGFDACEGGGLNVVPRRWGTNNDKRHDVRFPEKVDVAGDGDEVGQILEDGHHGYTHIH
jgi:hypothetical protein